jgi:CHAT domain-containing protein/tetratricopeptide (TPR) repeat protein
VPALRILTIAFVILLTGTGVVFAESLTDVDKAIDGYLAAGKTDSAAALVGHAIELAHAEHRGDSLAVAAYADSLGIRFFNAYDARTGVELIETGVALRLSVLPDDDPALAGPLELLSTAYYIAGRINDAVPPQEHAVDIRMKSLGANDPATAKSRYDLALVYYRLTRYDDAESQLRAALTAYKTNSKTDPLALAETERVLGEVHRELNRYDEAEPLMRDAVAVARKALPKDDPGLAVFLNSLAGFYKDQARYDESELLLEEALDIRTRAHLEDELAITTLNVAEIYRLQGRFDDAIPRYRRALALAQKTLPPLEVAEFHNQIAAAYADMGRPKDAESHFRLALAVADSSTDASPQVVAQFKHDLGVLLAREGRQKEGEQYLKEAIALRESVFGRAHPLVAVSLTQLARSRASLFDAMAAKPARGDAEAAALLDRALAILDSTDAEPEARVDAGIARAEIYYRNGKKDRAASTMAASLDAVEVLRPHRGGGGAERIEFIRRYVDAYDRMTTWQVERSDIPSALIYSERRRARVLVDRLTGTKSATATPEARAALDRLRAEKRDLEQRLGKCQGQAQALRSKPKLTKAERSELARIESNCDDIAGDVERLGERIRGMPGVHGPKTVQVTALARDEPQLLYHIGTLSSYVFVWGAGAADARVYSLALNTSAASTLGVPAGALTRAGLARILTGYDEKGERSGIGITRELAESQAANAVTVRAREQTQGRLHALFTVLVPEEVWTSVRKATEVVVITDGPLAAFPFEAFIVSAAKGDAVYWLDDGPAIRYAPSIAALAALAQSPRRASSPRVLSVCNPHYAALDPLPGTVRETESVVGAFGKKQVTVLCGEDATEAAACRAMAGKEIVHLATHGLINQRRSDLLASLAFTPSTSASNNLHDDGFLQLFEIDDLALSAELVVLSACESSTGSYVLGEGVMALSRGFLSAGARRVVATQWKVDDRTTAVLVGDFLTRVAHDPSADMALALRDAKRAVRQAANTSQPFYWAAFVITGAR